MDKQVFRKLTSAGIIIALLVLTYFLLKPILISVLIALMLAFLLYPVYLKINKVVKSRNISALIVCFLLASVIVIPIWFFTPILLKQSFEFFLTSQNIDFVTPLKKIFPDLFASEAFSLEIGTALNSFVSKATNSMVNFLAGIIKDFPILLLQFLVMCFTFFFALKDQRKITDYIRGVLPFSKEVENKIFRSSRGITFSVVYGQVVLGIIQGLLVGIGLFLFGVDNALFFTLLAGIAGIFPIVGTMIIWVPVVIYLFVTGQVWPALGVSLFGLLSSATENFIKPIFISKRIDMHPALVLISMVGGLLVFGILGVIIGPLIFAYLFIILEFYKDKKAPGVFKTPEETPKYNK